MNEPLCSAHKYFNKNFPEMRNMRSKTRQLDFHNIFISFLIDQ